MQPFKKLKSLTTEYSKFDHSRFSVTEVEENERETVIVQRRAIRALSDMVTGSIISRNNTFPLRPCPKDGIQPCDISQIEGKKLNRNIKKGDIIKISDLI